jgi:hypothetical protein
MAACTRPGIFFGIETTLLQRWLAESQQALHDLKTGAQGQSYSYTQGDGAKAVTYTPANTPALEEHIRELQAALGLIAHSRSPVRFRYT